MMEIINTNYIEHIELKEEQLSYWKYFPQTLYEDSFWNFITGRMGKVKHEECVSDESNPLSSTAITIYITGKPNNTKLRNYLFIRDKQVFYQSFVKVTLSSGKSHFKYFDPGTKKEKIDELIKTLQTPDKKVEI